MRIFTALAAIVLAGAASAAAGEFEGTYTAVVQGSATTLSLQRDGTRLVGRISGFGGQTLGVEAEVEGATASGFLSDPQSGMMFEVHMSLSGDGLSMVLYVPDPESGEVRPVSHAFTRQGAAPSTPAPAAPAPPGGGLGGVLGQGTAPATMTGTYNGTLQGTPMVLRLEHEGEKVGGKVDAAGYVYLLEGTASGSSARGKLNDPQTGGGAQFEIAWGGGDSLTLTIVTTDPATGQAGRVPVTFQRAGTSGASGSTVGGPLAGAAGAGPGAGESAEAAVERDPALVGRWRWSESTVSGSFSMVNEQILEIHPDGRYVLGEMRVVGGGDTGSFDGGRSGAPASVGQWKTRDRVVYVQEQGTSQWYPHARYYVEAGRMMFTMGDGSRQVWERLN